MFLANCGYLPPHAPEVTVVFKFVLPLAIPLLLLSANVVAILTQTRSMLAVFFLGAAATLAARCGHGRRLACWRLPRWLALFTRALTRLPLLPAACPAGSVLAMALFPLTPLGPDGWKIAAALTARHIGGAVNYVVRRQAAVAVRTACLHCMILAGLLPCRACLPACRGAGRV